MTGYKEFEFNLPDALLTSLVRVFAEMDSAPLTMGNAASIPDEQGIYQLILNGEIVYIGKTDGDAGLRSRLTRHAYTVQHRKNLVPEHVLFKAVRVFVFTAVDLETQLIRHYGAQRRVPWNNSGFGSNDPGRNRDDTALNPQSFDAHYPIDIDFVLPPITARAPLTVASVLTALSEALPYTLRYERGNAELTTSSTALPAAAYTVRQLLVHLATSLPNGWQATKLAGRVIFYKESRTYPHGEIIVRTV